MFLILTSIRFHSNFVYYFIPLDYITSSNISYVSFSYIFPPFTFNSLYKIEAFINTCINNDVITVGEMCLLFVLGCEFHDVSFGPGQTKGSWSSELHPDRENWSFYSYIGGGHTGTVFPSTIRNPNKAICTINSKTSEVMKRPVQPPKFMIMMHKKLSSTFFLGEKPPKTWF